MLISVFFRFGVFVKATVQTPVRIAAILPQRSDVSFWSDIEEGMKQAADQYNVELSVLYTKSTNPSLALEINPALEIAIMIRPDAILVSYADADERTDQLLLEAREANIKVVLVDNDSDERLRDYCVGIDNATAGQLIAQAVMSELDTGKKATLIDFDGQRQNIRQRADGVRQCFQSAGEDLITIILPSETQLERMIELEKMLEQHPDIGAIITCEELSTLSAAHLLSGRGLSDTINLYGFDLTKDTQKLLEENIIRALLVQNPVSMGVESIKASLALINGKSPEADSIHQVVRLCYREDLQDYLQE